MLPDFVPSGYDEDQVDSLYSYLKPKEVDATQYENKINFFSKCIDRYLQQNKSVMVSYYDLERKLQMGDRIPAPLYGTLTELYQKGTIKTPTEVEKSGWIAWGASWLNPFATPKEVQKNDQFIHIPTLKILGKELVKLHESLIHEDDDHPEVIGYGDLQQAARGIIADSASFKYAIEDLEREGILSTGVSQTGERVIKFRSESTRAPVKFTAVDASVHELRRQMKKLRLEISSMEQKEQALKASAKAAVQQNNKSLALQHLRRKKQIDKELEMRENAYDKLHGMLDNLYQMKQSKEVVEAYKLGNKAFKATLEQHGLNPEEVDQTIDDIRETMEDFNEINDLLGARDGSSVDDADLEAEFSAIVAEEKLAESKNRVIVNKNIIDLGGLPEIPSDKLPVATPQKSTDSLEERMRRLREAA